MSRYSFYTPELNLLAETDWSASTPAMEWEYIWFNGQPVAQIATATGTVDWYFNDHLGTPIIQTDASAQVTWRAEYEPYGEVFAFRAGASKHQPLRFPGQENDEASELSYNIFRWYRAGWGRYTQVDPMGLRGGTNLFLYTGADPIRSSDPLGLIRYRRSEEYVHNPNGGGIMDHGNTAPHLRIDARCSQTSGGCWRLEFEVNLRFTVLYDDEATRTHEEGHILIFENPFLATLSTFLPYERLAYASERTCRNVGQREISRVMRDINWYSFRHVLHDDGFSFPEWLLYQGTRP
jgi:RHS repeat-associated protein